MAISTVIEGDPAALTAVATWLRQGLAAGLDEACATLAYVREDHGGWSGSAGDAFRARMLTVATPATDLHDATLRGAQGIDTFAAALATAQSRTTTVRTSATLARLTVDATAIREPGSVPTRPAVPDPDATPAQVNSYDRAVSAYSSSVALWQAYETAATGMATITTDLATAADDLTTTQGDVTAVVMPTADVLLATVIETTSAAAVGAVAGQSQHLLDLARGLEANTRLPGAALNPELLYRDLDDAARLRLQAASTTDDAARALRIGKGIGLGAAGLLTGVSIWLDIQAGESVAQAATSNVVGLGASIAAGAATGAIVGSFVPVPIVGTVVGAIVGAGIGIFTSGAVDSLFENGPDVGAALAQGWDDLADTGAAVGGLAVGATDAVGDAADWAADGLSDAWDSVFG